MCGGSDVTYTYNRTNLALNITKVDTLADGMHIRTEYKDGLRRPQSCCWSKTKYIRPLTEADVDESAYNSSHNAIDSILQSRKRNIQQSKDKLEREANEGANKNNKCAIL